jgi:hypothetical protein
MLRRLLLTVLLGLLISLLPGAMFKASDTIANPSRQKPEQTRPAASTDEQAALMLRALSPYLIEWFIDVNEDVDLKQIWRLLKIDLPADTPHRCSDCSAETFELNIKGEEHTTVALRISFESGEFYQYLIFKKKRSESTEEWKFIGNLDSRGQKSGPPAHRIESGDNRAWFVVRESWGQKTGTKANGEVWYEIRDEEVRPVLSYPVEGQITPCLNQPGRSYKSILLRHELDDGLYTVPIQLLVSYEISECAKGKPSPALFAKAQKAYYVWNSEKQRFIFAESRSDLTEKELGEVYNAEPISHEKFVGYNFKELSEIARAGDSKQKRWLRSFLTGVKEGPQKLALQQALAE